MEKKNKKKTQPNPETSILSVAEVNKSLKLLLKEKRTKIY